MTDAPDSSKTIDTLVQDIKLRGEMHQALGSLVEVNRTLGEDVDIAFAHLETDASNTALRSFIRAFFASVDGSLFAFKQLALLRHLHNPCLTEAEVLLLREESPEVDASGRVSQKAKFIDTCANVRFVSRIMQKTFVLPEAAAFDFSLDGWSKFQDAVKIRNAITHPKDVESLTISENDDGKGQKVDSVAIAAEWYGKQMAKLSQAAMEAIRRVYITHMPAET